MGEGVKLYNSRVVRSATPVLGCTATGGYGAGELLGTQMTFSDVIGVDQGGGAITGIQIIDKDDQTEAIDILLFQEEVGSGTGGVLDAVALTLADSDLDNCVASISVDSGSFVSLASNAVATKALDIPFYIRGRDLYGLAVAKGTPTYTTGGGIEVRLSFERDA